MVVPRSFFCVAILFGLEVCPWGRRGSRPPPHLHHGLPELLLHWGRRGLALPHNGFVYHLFPGFIFYVFMALSTYFVAVVFVPFFVFYHFAGGEPRFSRSPHMNPGDIFLLYGQSFFYFFIPGLLAGPPGWCLLVFAVRDVAGYLVFPGYTSLSVARRSVWIRSSTLAWTSCSSCTTRSGARRRRATSTGGSRVLRARSPQRALSWESAHPRVRAVRPQALNLGSEPPH